MSSTPIETTRSATIQPGSLHAWLIATRPATLLVGIVPVMVGASIAYRLGSFRIIPALAALAGALLIQIGTNFANDVFDYEKGADNEARLGPTRVTQSGLLSADQVRTGMWVSFALALLIGIYLVAISGWVLVAIGMASIASGIAYTGGPWPLGYNGLGDIFVFVFFGWVAVCGTVFVIADHVPWYAFLAAVPIGAFATAVLAVNNVRDVSTDHTAGKRTLAVRFGRRFGVIEYAILMIISYATPIALMIFSTHSYWILLPLITAPFACILTLKISTHQDGPTLNRCLAQTAKLLLSFGLLFCIGLLLH